MAPLEQPASEQRALAQTEALYEAEQKARDAAFYGGDWISDGGRGGGAFAFPLLIVRLVFRTAVFVGRAVGRWIGRGASSGPNGPAA